MSENYSSVRFGNIDVFYTHDLDGGGMSFGQDYLDFLRDKVGPVERVYEWCSGPGFIGFSLLAAGLCKSLCLADVNPKAVAALEQTVLRNGLQKVVSVYTSDCLDAIPSSESWDLVVSNPPHCGSSKRIPGWGPHILYSDPGWQLHRRFYSNVSKFLKPTGNIIIQENYFCSQARDFLEMVEQSGWRVKSVSPSTAANYFLWSTPSERVKSTVESDDSIPSTSAKRTEWAWQKQQDPEETNLLKDLGLERQDYGLTPSEIVERRKGVLASPMVGAGILKGNVKLTLRGKDDDEVWALEFDPIPSRVSRLDRDRKLKWNSELTMNGTLFVELYERQRNALHAYIHDEIVSEGDLDLSSRVFQILVEGWKTFTSP